MTQTKLFFTHRISGTKYKVHIGFAENATDTFEDKLIRIIEKDLDKPQKSGTIEPPQMSCPSERSA